jgi:hypothetical protein
MCKVTEAIIKRVETAISLDVPPQEVADFLMGEGLSSDEAFLVYRAAEVSLRLRYGATG